MNMMDANRYASEYAAHGRLSYSTNLENFN